MDNKFRIKIIFTLFLSIILLILINTESNAYTIEGFNTKKGKEIIFDGVKSNVFSKFKIPKRTMALMIGEINRILKQVPSPSNLKIAIANSDNTSNLVAFKVTSNGKYYIVFVSKVKLKDIRASTLHELGHVWCDEMKIDIDEYMKFVYGEDFEKLEQEEWANKYRENFAEDFKIFASEEFFKVEENRKLTNFRIEKEKFKEFMKNRGW